MNKIIPPSDKKKISQNVLRLLILTNKDLIKVPKAFKLNNKTLRNFYNLQANVPSLRPALRHISQLLVSFFQNKIFD